MTILDLLDRLLNTPIKTIVWNIFKWTMAFLIIAYFLILFGVERSRANSIEKSIVVYVGAIYVCTVPQYQMVIREREPFEDDFYCGNDGRFRDIIRTRNFIPTYYIRTNGEPEYGVFIDKNACMDVLAATTPYIQDKYLPDGLMLTFVCERKVVNSITNLIFDSRYHFMRPI